MSGHILMVCTGNVCRSPIAAALLIQSMPGVATLSAGTHALVGRGADPLAMALMQERGIDLSAHVATALSDAHVRNANLILAMTRAHLTWLKTLYPEVKERVHLLCENDDTDVVDPYRRTRFTFELATSQIEHGLSHWLDAIRTLSA
ncbi:low molecular weight phosphotyrosine protein phosphatase [Paraburkholderia sp. CNPSo 3157]|uniref:protein-tyrosine-phosphatase n=1 Tax=Paraburkholderia franconis TaxID=2654983 RepID=A0A7X1NFD7_9BURK|nr:low molecular weight protein-tyrosine-phosphatase [Paraburkholderia franconis]MPW20869.1 low molecular weight phosphotyrosine protein phosphatase [Paraburkholderia franconis]